MTTIQFKNSKSGQAFLIMIMFVAVAITVALASSFKVVTETQNTVSQEESLRAVAAADSAVEFGLTMPQGSSGQTFRQLGLLDFDGINLDQSRVTVNTTAATTEFVSPVLKKDNQYTLYWVAYQDDTIGASAARQDLRVQYGSFNGADCNQIALEITVLSGDINNVTMRRFIADTGNLLGTDTDELAASAVSRTVRGQTFACEAVLPANPVIPDQTKFIFIRYLTTGTGETRLGFTANSIPPQGKIVRADVASTTGVRKIVESFQSYPQIPAEIFTTSL